MTASSLRPRKVLEPDFEEVLKGMGPKAEALEWWVGPHPAGAGPAALAGRFFDWGDSGEWVPGKAFLEVVNQGVEMFGGEVRARRVGARASAVTFRAVAHTGWDIEADDLALVSDLLNAFPDAVHLQAGGFRIPHGSLKRESGTRGDLEEPPERTPSGQRLAPDPLDDLMGDGAPEREKEW